jgi:cell division protein FtsQ
VKKQAILQTENDNRTYKKLLLLLAMLVIYLLYRSLNVYLLPIEKLYVSGNVKHTAPAQIEEVVKETVSHGFFAVNLDSVRQALEQLRWVQNVTVRRVWPNGLQISIQEHVAVARWGQTYLINQRGKLFIPDDLEQAKTLPMLLGPPGMHRFLWGQYRELQSIMQDTGMEVAQLVFDSRHAMRLTTKSGIEIQLGRVRNVNDSYVEFSMFARAFSDKFSDRKDRIVSIDLRYTNGFAIEWRDGTEATNQHYKNLT